MIKVPGNVIFIYGHPWSFFYGNSAGQNEWHIGHMCKPDAVSFKVDTKLLDWFGAIYCNACGSRAPKIVFKLFMITKGMK